MQGTSALYKQIALGDYETRVKLKVELTPQQGETPATYLNYTMADLISLKITTTTLGSDSQKAGNYPSSQLDITMRYPSDTIPRMAKMLPYFQIANATNASEWLPLGVFYVDTRVDGYDTDSNVRTLSFVCYDAMLKASQDYYNDTGDQGLWPKTDIAVVNEIAQRIGVSVDPSTTTLLSEGYRINYPDYGEASYTMRGVLQTISAIYGCNCVIDEVGNLKFVDAFHLPVTPDINVGTKYGDLNIPLVSLPFKRVEINYKDAASGDTTGYFSDPWTANTAYVVGDIVSYNCFWYKCITAHTSSTIFDESKWNEKLEASDGISFVVNAPLVKSEDLPDVLSSLVTKSNNFTIRPYTASEVILDPSSQIGDSIQFNTLYSQIFNRNIEFGILSTINLEIPYSTEVSHEYEYVSEGANSIRRDASEVKASLNILADQISSVVEGQIHTYRCNYSTLPSSSSLHPGDLWYNTEDYSSEGTIVYTADTWYRYSDTRDWEETTSTIDVAPNWDSATTYYYGDVVTYNGKWWSCIVPMWERSTSYDVDDAVQWEDPDNDTAYWYICTTAHTSGDTFDPTKWSVYTQTAFEDDYWVECQTVSTVSKSQIDQGISHIKLEVGTENNTTYLQISNEGIDIAASKVSIAGTITFGDLNTGMVNLLNGKLNSSDLYSKLYSEYGIYYTQIGESYIISPKIAGGEIWALQETGMVRIDGSGFSFATPVKTNVITLTYEEISNRQYPVILMGEGNALGSNKGMIKKYTRGIFIGDDDDLTTGSTQPTSGDGLFINFNNHTLYQCVNGTLTSLGTAVFG